MLQVQPDGTLYVDADMAIRNVAVIAETAIDLAVAFKPHGFGIETNQFQELLATEIGRQLNERRIPLETAPTGQPGGGRRTEVGRDLPTCPAAGFGTGVPHRGHGSGRAGDA